MSFFASGYAYLESLGARAMDEARISSSARSGDWIQTSYSSMNDPGSFYDIDVEIEISENLIHLLLPALAIPLIIGSVVRKTRAD